MALDARTRLRELFEADQQAYLKIRDVYWDALEAVTADGRPDHRTRLEASNSYMAQIYGKPQQNIQAKHEVTIQVVNRTREALMQPAADVELDEPDVRELPEAPGE
jgi:hypothetical protein